jgi:hypothetical protein
MHASQAGRPVSGQTPTEALPNGTLAGRRRRTEIVGEETGEGASHEYGERRHEGYGPHAFAEIDAEERRDDDGHHVRQGHYRGNGGDGASP